MALGGLTACHTACFLSPAPPAAALTPPRIPTAPGSERLAPPSRYVRPRHPLLRLSVRPSVRFNTHGMGREARGGTRSGIARRSGMESVPFRKCVERALEKAQTLEARAPIIALGHSKCGRHRATDSKCPLQNLGRVAMGRCNGKVIVFTVQYNAVVERRGELLRNYTHLGPAAADISFRCRRCCRWCRLLPRNLTEGEMLYRLTSQF